MHLCYSLCADLIPEIRILDPLKRVAAIYQAIVNHGLVVIIAIISCYEVDRVISRTAFSGLSMCIVCREEKISMWSREFVKVHVSSIH